MSEMAGMIAVRMKGWLVLLFRKLPSISVFHKIIPQTMNKHTACSMIDQPRSKHWDISQWAKRESMWVVAVVAVTVGAWQSSASHGPVGKRALAGWLAAVLQSPGTSIGPRNTNKQEQPSLIINKNNLLLYFILFPFCYRNAMILMLSYYSIIKYWQLIHQCLVLFLENWFGRKL